MSPWRVGFWTDKMSEKSIVAGRSQDDKDGVCDGVGEGIGRCRGDLV